MRHGRIRARRCVEQLLMAAGDPNYCNAALLKSPNYLSRFHASPDQTLLGIEFFLALSRLYSTEGGRLKTQIEPLGAFPDAKTPSPAIGGGACEPPDNNLILSSSPKTVAPTRRPLRRSELIAPLFKSASQPQQDFINHPSIVCPDSLCPKTSEGGQ